MAAHIPPDAFALIIGAMKSGTSSLFTWLQDHPQICPARVKEPEFFSENQGHRGDVPCYADLWSFDPAIHRYALEASTGYTKYPMEPAVPRKMFEAGLRPRFLYVLRNPFDRIVSHYNYMRFHGASHLTILDPHLIHTSNYHLQLEQYRKYFADRDFLLLDFDELRRAPANVLVKIYDFLGIAPDHFPEVYDVANPTQLESPVEQSLRRRLQACLDYVPRPVKRVGRQVIRQVFPPEKRTLSAAEREFVYQQLHESMTRLHETWGVDVRAWGFEVAGHKPSLAPGPQSTRVAR